ncbi:MAG TPA: methyltransferase domain-containing protein [Deinococcales bacterium]|nr:methyltransferase domain-containing protein [Deinococcales bacterium]
MTPGTAPVRVILGARDQAWPGWVPTQQDELDLTRPESFAAWFGGRRADAFLCEHVLEHLSLEEGEAAARTCFAYLKPGGLMRVAVPDRNFRNEAYQKYVQVGGPGPAGHPSATHRIVYDHRTLAGVFERAGFAVDLLEYCDEGGRFHYNHWDPEEGPVARSLLFDPRNAGGRLGWVSLILDARTPG